MTEPMSKSPPSMKKVLIIAAVAAVIGVACSLTVALIQNAPNNAEAYNDRGLAYRKKGEFDKAIDDYKP